MYSFMLLLSKVRENFIPIMPEMDGVKDLYGHGHLLVFGDVSTMVSEGLQILLFFTLEHHIESLPALLVGSSVMVLMSMALRKLTTWK